MSVWAVKVRSWEVALLRMALFSCIEGRRTSYVVAACAAALSTVLRCPR